MFSGDNGGNDYFVTPEFPAAHSANKNPQTGVEFRGRKASSTKAVAPPGRRAVAGQDRAGPGQQPPLVFPDAADDCERHRAKAPADIDGLSLLPELIGKPPPAGSRRSTNISIGKSSAKLPRMGEWKAYQPARRRVNHDLRTDISERNGFAKSRPSAKLQAYATAAHTRGRGHVQFDRAARTRSRGEIRRQPAAAKTKGGKKAALTKQ